MIKVIAILTIICMLLGAAVGAGIYFYKDSDSSSDSSSNGSSNNSNVDSSLDSSSSSTGDSSSDMGSGVAGESSSGVDGLDDSGGTTSSRGGLTGPPPPPAPGEYTELASSAKPKRLCTKPTKLIFWSGIRFKFFPASPSTFSYMLSAFKKEFSVSSAIY